MRTGSDQLYPEAPASPSEREAAGKQRGGQARRPARRGDTLGLVASSVAERVEAHVIADGLRRRDEPAQLQRVVQTCGYLSTLGAQPTDLPAIAQMLFESLGTSVVVLDRGLEVTASAGVASPRDLVARLHDQTGRSG